MRAYGIVSVEGIALVRHRHAQSESRLSAHADDRRPDVDDQRSEPDLPRQQRRAESADRIDLAVGEQRARRLGRRCSCRTSGRVERLTLQGALRFDRAVQLVPGAAGGTVAIPARRRSSSRRRAALTATRTRRREWARPTTCSANGRTALKASLGKYLEGAGVTGTYANSNPTLRHAADDDPRSARPGVTRAWTDANQNFVPDCDLLNPAAQDLRASGGDLCGVMSNTSFGRNVLTNNFDPAHPQRVGRPSVGLDPRRVDPAADRPAVARWTSTYIRRWFRGFSVVDNRALQPSDLTPFSIVAPRDPRLPGGGGYAVSGLYDVVPEKAGQVDNLVADSGDVRAAGSSTSTASTSRSTRGSARLHARRRHQHGSDGRRQLRRARAPAGVRRRRRRAPARLAPGLAGSAVTPREPVLPCRVRHPHAVPRAVLVRRSRRSTCSSSATFQSKPGAMLAANYAVAERRCRAVARAGTFPGTRRT